MPIADEVFVEFGVQDYSEANTRFLLVQDNRRGLIIDGDDARVRYVQAAGWSGSTSWMRSSRSTATTSIG